MKNQLTNWIKLKIQQTKCHHRHGLLNTDHVQCSLCGKVKYDPDLSADLIAEYWYKNIKESDPYIPISLLY